MRLHLCEDYPPLYLLSGELPDECRISSTLCGIASESLMFYGHIVLINWWLSGRTLGYDSPLLPIPIIRVLLMPKNIYRSVSVRLLTIAPRISKREKVI